MKKETIKTFTIIVLILIIVLLIITNFLKQGSNVKAKKLFKEILTVQSNISNYIGKMKSNTFEIYTTQQILIGSTDIENILETRIKNFENDDLIQIVIDKDKISQDNSTFYKINIDNFKKKFNYNLYNEDEITWYIQDNGDIKISYIIKPSWWIQELDIMYIGV